MTNNSKISIKFRNSLQYEYSSEKKYSFTDFMSNIGGLFGLWFGISFVDMSQLFQTISMNIKNYLLAHIDFNRILSLLIKLKRFKFIIFFIYFVKKFKIGIKYIDKINWENVIKVFSLPFIIYQIWDLTDDYLKYPMDVSVEWFPYKDSNYRLSDESIPAITVCYEHIFERILFDQNIQDSFNYNMNHSKIGYIYSLGYIEDRIQTNDTNIQNLIGFYYNIFRNNIIASFEISQFYQTYYNESIKEVFLQRKKSETKILLKDSLLYYLDVNNKTEFIERQFRLNDKTFNDFNLIQKQLDFFNSILSCGLGHTKTVFFKINFNKCDKFRKDIRILSPLGKCFTYLSQIEQDQFKDNRDFKTDIVFTIREYRTFESTLQNIRYFKKRFFIHSSKELPDFTTNEFELTDNSVIQLNSYRIAYNRIDFKKLPKPYETNCHNYGNSNRFECLNECYLNGYNQKWNCTPNDNHLLTVVLKNNSIEPKVKFCHKTDNETQIFNSYLREHCFKNCLESCEHVYFSTSIGVDVHNVDDMFSYEVYSPDFKFLIKEKFYSQIIFNPRITFNDLIISITNILSLWHGMSILSILSYLLIVLMIILSKVKTRVKQNVWSFISLASNWVKVF